MNENFSDSGDEILEASFAAMRGADGSGWAAGDADCRNDCGAERGGTKAKYFWRMNNMKFVTGMAASVLLVIGAVVVAILMLRSPEVTCAEVVEAVRERTIMSFVVTTGAMPNKPPTRMKMLHERSGPDFRTRATTDAEW